MPNPTSFTGLPATDQAVMYLMANGWGGMPPQEAYRVLRQRYSIAELRDMDIEAVIKTASLLMTILERKRRVH